MKTATLSMLRKAIMLLVWIHLSMFPPLAVMFPIICSSLKPTYLRGGLHSLAGLRFHFPNTFLVAAGQAPIDSIYTL